jgi:CRISPR-associated protein Cas1
MLKDKAKKCFIEELDSKLKTTINHREIGRQVSYRRLLRLELYKLEKHLMSEKKYEALLPGGNSSDWRGVYMFIIFMISIKNG